MEKYSCFELSIKIKLQKTKKLYFKGSVKMNIKIRAAKKNERPIIAHMIDLAFDDEPYGSSLKKPCQYVGHCDMDPHDCLENTRVLLVDRNIASVIHIAQREAYVHGEHVLFAFIAMVATHPEYRRRGYIRNLMRDAEDYMKKKGNCYSVMLGAFHTYTGSLGWHYWGEKNLTLNSKYVVQQKNRPHIELATRPAENRDIPFLVQVYKQRYTLFFGPVVRSEKYWDMWSLQCNWEGKYIIVTTNNELPIGYFHVSPDNSSIDEIGWDNSLKGKEEQIFIAALDWTFSKGLTSMYLWIDKNDKVAEEAMRKAFSTIDSVYCKPAGQSADESDPTPFLPQNNPNGVGILVKSLQKGPGILSDINNTDQLTDLMATHSWTWFGGDTM
jgi:GNAT superfamily N-acetyltransferase